MSLGRARLLSAFLFLLLGGLSVRLFHIQVLRGLSYSEMAQRQFVKKDRAETRRGDILDRNGRILATTVEAQSLFIRPKEVRDPNGLLRLASQALGLDPEEVSKKIHSREDFVWLERKCSPLLAEALAAKRIGGLGALAEQKRYYPNGILACHLLGFVGMDNSGLAGVELAADPLLKGKSYVVSHGRDGKGRKIGTAPDEDEGRPAASVSLTIDRSLQYVAERELKRGVEENQAESGMVLIQNPKTGEILASACYPPFDPEAFSRGRASAGPGKLQNPVVAKMFEPGSTFKVVTFAAALNEGKFSVDDEIDCENGEWKVGDAVINDHEPAGRISFGQVLEKSSNIGSAKIGIKLGKEKLYRYARAFGFGTRTGVDLPGETEGLFRDPRSWSAVSLPVLSFGQEIGVTAVQVVGAFSAIANGGLLMEPAVFKRAPEAAGAPIGSNVRRVVRAETAAALRRLLFQAVESGTGRKAKVEGYSVAGKTGTAQKIDPRTGRYAADRHLASFCGFLPAEDPELVCLVILDEPKRTSWGGETAAPVFSRVMGRVVQLLGIPPDRPAALARTTPARTPLVARAPAEKN